MGRLFITNSPKHIKLVSTSKVLAIWRFTILFFLLFNIQNGIAQNVTSEDVSAENISTQIRGKVTDAISHVPLIGATIQLIFEDEYVGLTSSSKEYFVFKNIKIGRYEMEVSYVGYETVRITDIQAESGKETILDIQLKESDNELGQIIVKANGNQDFGHQSLSHHIITVEETERFPATFYDPARLAASYSGIVNTNDQSNNFSIHGNSPSDMKWYLEGVEIVNPNHLSTAGMAGNQNSINGGGVNILSAQLLNTSTILKGNLPANYGNTVSGIMDMRLRSGNDENYEFTGQAGFLGFDFSAEGPLSKKTKASFLANYRYSFTGLLAAMGVDFGGEEITFQDFSMHLNFPTQKMGDFKFFGIWGDSQNDFSGVVDSTLRLEDKERFNINYSSNVLISGITHQISLNTKSKLQTSLVYTESENENNRENIDATEIGNAFNYKKEQKLSFNSFYQRKLKKGQKIKFGIAARVWKYDVLNSVVSEIPDFQPSFNGIYAIGKKTSTLLNAYIEYHSKIAEIIDLNASARYVYYDLFQEHFAEPRINLSINLEENQQIYLSWELNSQTHNAYVYSFRNASSNGGLPSGGFPQNIHFSKSFSGILGYKKVYNGLVFSVESYYQRIKRIPAVFSPGIVSVPFATLINTAGSISDIGVITERGEAINYGLELNIEKPFDNGAFALLNCTFYESKFRATSLRTWKATRWNGKYVFNATLGKEFIKEKEEKTRVLGINFHLVFAGGMRTKLVDEAASKNAGITVFEERLDFQEQLSEYLRPDLRFYLKWNKQKSNILLSLDIQNVINRENDGFYSYDFVQEKPVLQKQLGMIPVLNYRIEF